MKTMTDIDELIRTVPFARNILQLAQHDATVATFINSWRDGRFETWAEAMTRLSFHLALERKRLLERLVEADSGRPVEISIQAPEGEVLQLRQKMSHPQPPTALPS